MNEHEDADIKELAKAFEVFSSTTEKMEEAYRRLEQRVRDLDVELASKNHELALTSDYLNYVLESMSDGVIAVDTDERITTFNCAASDVLGFSADEVLGRPFEDVFGRDFSPAHGVQVVELCSKDQTDVPISERDSPMSDRSGQEIGAVKVFQDLTEIEALRKQVRQMDRLAAVGEMAATVAHEIRNPLGGIRGFATLLSRDLDENDPNARLVKKIIIGTKHLDKVVNELLEYTRPVELNLRSLDYYGLVEAALNYVGSDGKETTVENEVEKGLNVLADKDKMRQVLLNVILNAFQSIEREGRITISSASDNEYVTVHVSDNGCGIQAEDLEKVLSPFYTTKEKGSGLGLAIAEKIVETHGGTLEFESEAGKGSVFSVKLPRVN